MKYLLITLIALYGCTIPTGTEASIDVEEEVITLTINYEGVYVVETDYNRSEIVLDSNNSATSIYTANAYNTYMKENGLTEFKIRLDGSWTQSNDTVFVNWNFYEEYYLTNHFYPNNGFYSPDTLLLSELQ